MLWQAMQKIDDLECRVQRVESMVSNVDSNVVRIGIMVQKQQKGR